MVLALSNSAQASFFHEPDNEVPSDDRPSDNETRTRHRSASYSEILTYILPESPKVIEFNNLVDSILVSQGQISLMERDDGKTAEAMILLSNILEDHWQEFPLKVKVLLLKKLKVFKRSFWKSILASIPNTLSIVINRFNYYKGYWVELKTYDKLTQESILHKVSSDSKLLQNAWSTLKRVVLKIFKDDGYLLEDNRESISEFTNTVQTMVAGRRVMDKYSTTLKDLARSETSGHYIRERTPEETAEGLRRFEATNKYKRDLWNNMTEEEREVSISQFAILDEYLKESRR